MRLLRNEAFTRRPVSAGPRALRPGLLFLLMFVSISLLFLSRLHHRYVDELRLQLAELMAPALKAAVVPLDPLRRAGQRLGDYLDFAGEVDRLRRENQRLRGWEWRALESERKLSQLSRLANVIEEPGLDFVSGRVVADSSGPFVRSAMLAIGRDDGIKFGYPVVDGGGLVGRIVETGARASRVLLVTDINSRIPVQVGKSGIRAVLHGDNGPMPRIAHLPADAQIEPGDEVYSSGVGGMFPRGLRIGAVVDQGGMFRMRPHARLDELEFVSILLFDSPAIGTFEDDSGARSLRRGVRGSALEVQVPGRGRARHE